MEPSRRDTLKALGIAGAAAVVPATAAFASETSVQPGDTAAVRVAHASPDAPNVDVYVDGQPALEDVPYGAVSEYLPLPAGSHTVRVTPAGEDATVFEGEVTVEAGQAYTAAAVGNVTEGAAGGNATATPVETTPGGNATETPGDGMGGTGFRVIVLEDYRFANVRLLHAAPDAPAVDVAVDGGAQVVFSDVAFGQNSDYAAVPAGDYTLEVRSAGSEGGDPVATVDASVVPGGVYTAIAGGYLNPAEAPAGTEFSVDLVPDVAFADADLSDVWTGGDGATPTPTDGNATDGATETPNGNTSDGD